MYPGKKHAAWYLLHVHVVSGPNVIVIFLYFPLGHYFISPSFNRICGKVCASTFRSLGVHLYFTQLCVSCGMWTILWWKYWHMHMRLVPSQVSLPLAYKGTPCIMLFLYFSLFPPLCLPIFLSSPLSLPPPSLSHTHTLSPPRSLSCYYFPV